MKIFTFVTLALIAFNLTSSLKFEPKERQLLYKEKPDVSIRKTRIQNRILEAPSRELFIGTGDEEIVKIKAKRDMLKRKIEMDNGIKY